MADIMCDVVTGSDATVDSCETASQIARRRRMEIRQFKIVSSPPLEGKRQRVKLDLNASTSDVDGAPGVEDPITCSAAVAAPGYGMTSVCGRRREMEDAVSIHPVFHRDLDLHFFAVFDGHGCSHAAESCKERMHDLVADEITTNGCEEMSEWKRVMTRSFLRMDAEVCEFDPKVNCRCVRQLAKCDHVGSTAVVAVVTPDSVIVGNCGDSRAVLCRRGVPVPLSDDHKPDRPDEMQRIQAAGGKVIYWDGARVLGVLAMSRAIGDDHLKPYVTAEPEVTVTKRTEDDECLIIASDGLWDVISNETACEVAATCLSVGDIGELRTTVVESGTDKRGGSDRACIDAAILLTKLALARRTEDNVSVLVVDLRRGTRRSSGSVSEV